MRCVCMREYGHMCTIAHVEVEDNFGSQCSPSIMVCRGLIRVLGRVADFFLVKSFLQLATLVLKTRFPAESGAHWLSMYWDAPSPASPELGL